MHIIQSKKHLRERTKNIERVWERKRFIIFRLNKIMKETAVIGNIFRKRMGLRGGNLKDRIEKRKKNRHKQKKI